MAIFFSMKKLLSYSKGNCSDIRQIVYNSFYKIQPKSLYNKKLFNKDISGKSFILNLVPLFDPSVSDWEFASYLYLCSFRNYSDYKLLGIKYLDLNLIPDIDISKHKQNKLLKIENRKIYFKYEE
jgi:hypothetical protein